MANLKKEDRKERLDLLITTIEPAVRMTRPPNPLENGVIIHFANFKESSISSPANYFDIILISMELSKGSSGVSWGPYSIGKRKIDVKHDLSDQVHLLGYCRKILQFNNPFAEEQEKVWDDVERTSFLQRMSIEAWEKSWQLLNKIRWFRIQNRIKEPRTKSWQKFEYDDDLDRALAKIIARVNAMLNGVMYWGQVKEGVKFSNDLQ